MAKIHQIPTLPLQQEVETKAVLKRLNAVRAALAGLNGVAESIPNERIILNTLSLQEAKDSSAIENIVTTHDELYTSDTITRQFTSHAAKEVYNYAQALLEGFSQVKESGLITVNHILKLQELLEENDAGFRKVPGTALKNDQTGETVYTPPQEFDKIIDLMSNLELFINDGSLTDLDPVVKMAIIHHQFESIHPFYDGNGRTGRIINILYLVKENLLKLPILYLSRYINQNKSTYYSLLQQTRETNNWEPWILYMLDAVEETAVQTSFIIREIKKLMVIHKQKIRSELPRIYSQDLINSLFKHPYTKIEFIKNDLRIARKTAGRHLDQLCEIGLITKNKIGKENYYFNNDLIELLINVSSLKKEEGEQISIVTENSKR
ncbi:MAG: Fic family protein [Bacteroidota bacterium]|uniref:Fic family protein n=1 Tax=Pedobacter cryotolerans TaxID=2571270 RepID=A0A4U1CA15_9SPHI|nr:Fic family protein [Pedobacter cryotolerans]TKC03289.1 Fic family protein [Pedobacter cryotolerans]